MLTQKERRITELLSISLKFKSTYNEIIKMGIVLSYNTHIQSKKKADYLSSTLPLPTL